MNLVTYALNTAYTLGRGIKVVKIFSFSHFDLFPPQLSSFHLIKVCTFFLSQVWYIVRGWRKVHNLVLSLRITQSWGFAWVPRSKLRAQVKTFTSIFVFLFCFVISQTMRLLVRILSLGNNTSSGFYSSVNLWRQSSQICYFFTWKFWFFHLKLGFLV